MMTLEQALDALAEARCGLARWQAWHAKQFGAPFPAEDQQPPDWASWIAAASEWGVAEADHLFPNVHPDERELALRAVLDRTMTVSGATR